MSLEQLVRSVQFSFTDLARTDASESSTLRQKYLLHFFYKYISRYMHIASFSLTEGLGTRLVSTYTYTYH